MRTGSKNLSAYVRKKTLQESGYQEGAADPKGTKELVYQFRKIGTISIRQRSNYISDMNRRLRQIGWKNMKLLERQFEK